MKKQRSYWMSGSPSSRMRASAGALSPRGCCKRCRRKRRRVTCRSKTSTVFYCVMISPARCRWCSRNGRMEDWNTGKLEDWNTGRVKTRNDGKNGKMNLKPIFQHSNIPIFHSLKEKYDEI